MNITKSRRSLFAIFLLMTMLLLAPLSAYAAGSSVAIAVKDDIRTGNEFTVTVSFSSDKKIGLVSAALAYSRSQLEFIPSEFAQSGGEGIVNISGSPTAGSEKMDVLLTFRAISGGKSDISVTNGTLMAPDGSVIEGSLAAAASFKISGDPLPPEQKETIVTLPDSSIIEQDSSAADESSSAPDSSSEADSSSMIPDDGGLARLTSLIISEDDTKTESGSKPEQFKLKPDFSPDVFDYEVTVHNDTEYISVDAELRDKLDTIWYDGSVYLAVGMTPWTITVTTPDGTVSHVYNIRVIRHEEGYVEESSEEESSSEEALSVTVIVSDNSGKPANQAETPKIPSEADPHGRDERPLRERLTPILIIALCVIASAVLFIVIRIRMRSKNPLGQTKQK